MIAMLILQLERGWTICAAATDQHERDRLEHYWISLLREYEKAVDAEQEFALFTPKNSVRQDGNPTATPTDPHSPTRRELRHDSD